MGLAVLGLLAGYGLYVPGYSSMRAPQAVNPPGVLTVNRQGDCRVKIESRNESYVEKPAKRDIIS